MIRKICESVNISVDVYIYSVRFSTYIMQKMKTRVILVAYKNNKCRDHKQIVLSLNLTVTNRWLIYETTTKMSLYNTTIKRLNSKFNICTCCSCYKTLFNITHIFKFFAQHISTMISDPPIIIILFSSSLIFPRLIFSA